jgi:Ca2+-binding RTX toxin-like protein
MKRLNRNLLQSALVAIMLVGLVTSAYAIEPTVITFDNGTEGWDANPDCETIFDEGGNPDAYWNFANRECDGNYFVRAYFDLRTSTNPAFIGDYTSMGPLRLSVDLNVNYYDYLSFWGPPMATEEYRKLIVEFIDYDNQYTSPEGYNWGWTSVMYDAGTFQNRDAGWKTFNIDIEDPFLEAQLNTDLPDGWTGYGGPEDSSYMPQLPPTRTFTDVLASVDEIVFHSIEPGYFYGIGFLHDMDVDNITLKAFPQECNGVEATVYVDYEGIIHGGLMDGHQYDGVLHGTMGHDVIVGTNDHDTINGRGGDDMICGRDGDDNINGQSGDDMIIGGEGDDNLIGQMGNDYLIGGEGWDHLNGGQGLDSCVSGENVNNCGTEGNVPVVSRSPENTVTTTASQPVGFALN